MDGQTFEREVALNRQAYDTLREHIRREYAGRYVALGQGRILASAATYKEVMAAVQQFHPVPEFFLVFAAGEEPGFEPYLAVHPVPSDGLARERIDEERLAASEDAEETWTHKNQRRLDLIEKKYATGLSAAEEIELAGLQTAQAKHLCDTAPLPFDVLERLEDLVDAATPDPGQKP